MCVPKILSGGKSSRETIKEKKRPYLGITEIISRLNTATVKVAERKIIAPED